MLSGSGGIKLFSQSLERLAFVFARSLGGARHCPRRFACLGSALSSRHAVGRFLVKGLRDRCAAPLFTGAFDDDLAFIPALPNPQHIARRDFPGDFDALSCQLHLSAFDGGLGQCTRFEKARCPQPFVDADLFGAVCYLSQVQEAR
jgi:hypothetical protein